MNPGKYYVPFSIVRTTIQSKLCPTAKAPILSLALEVYVKKTIIKQQHQTMQSGVTKPHTVGIRKITVTKVANYFLSVVGWTRSSTPRTLRKFEQHKSREVLME